MPIWANIVLWIIGTGIGAVAGVYLPPVFEDAARLAHLENSQPCLEVFGHVSEVIAGPILLSNASFVSQLWNYMQHGQSYAYSQTIRNTGDRALYNIVIRLNFPGSPYVTWTNRTDAEIDVGLASVTYIEYEPYYQGVRGINTYIRDPRVVTEADLHYLRQIDQDETGQSRVSSIDILWPNDPDHWNRSAIHAVNSAVVEYRLDFLRPGEEWSIQTIYFGNRTAPGAGGRLASTAEAFDGLAKPHAHALTAFYSDVGDDAIIRDCSWGP